MFAGVELREPTRESQRGGLVVLDLSPGVGRAEALERLGEPDGYVERAPWVPASQPEYEVYGRTWGTLKLGYREDQLVCIVADAMG